MGEALSIHALELQSFQVDISQSDSRETWHPLPAVLWDLATQTC